MKLGTNEVWIGCSYALMLYLLNDFKHKLSQVLNGTMDVCTESSVSLVLRNMQSLLCEPHKQGIWGYFQSVGELGELSD